MVRRLPLAACALCFEYVIIKSPPGRATHDMRKPSEDPFNGLLQHAIDVPYPIQPIFVHTLAPHLETRARKDIHTKMF